MTAPDPTPEDVEALANLISLSPCNRDADNHPATRCPVALAILESDWLAQRDARIRAEALREAADAGASFLGYETDSELAWVYLRERADRIEAGGQP